MAPEITLRDAVPADAEIVCSIHNESIATQTATMETERWAGVVAAYAYVP